MDKILINPNPDVLLAVKVVTLPPDVPWYRSCRFQLVFITAWGYVFYYLLRVDLSLAIICMVRDPDAAAGHDDASNSGNESTASVRPSFQLNIV